MKTATTIQNSMLSHMFIEHFCLELPKEHTVNVCHATFQVQDEIWNTKCKPSAAKWNLSNLCYLMSLQFLLTALGLLYYNLHTTQTFLYKERKQNFDNLTGKCTLYSHIHKKKKSYKTIFCNFTNIFRVELTVIKSNDKSMFMINKI